MDTSRQPVRAHPVHRIVTKPGRPTLVFVTVCTAGRLPLLANQGMKQTLLDVWSDATAWLVGRYMIMPDHVHLLVAPGDPELPMTNWVSYWKRMFSRRYGATIWQDDYWDTTVRSTLHLKEIWDYIEQNPVRRGLVTTTDDWPFAGELNELRWH